MTDVTCRCGVPAVAGGTNGSHCYLYAVPTALDWARHLVGGGCNMGVLGTWWSGMLQAKPPITKGKLSPGRQPGQVLACCCCSVQAHEQPVEPQPPLQAAHPEAAGVTTTCSCRLAQCAAWALLVPLMPWHSRCAGPCCPCIATAGCVASQLLAPLRLY